MGVTSVSGKMELCDTHGRTGCRSMRHQPVRSLCGRYSCEVEKLIIKGYILKDGGLYEFAPKGEKVLAQLRRRTERSVVSLQIRPV